MREEELRAEIERLRAENERLKRTKRGRPSPRVSRPNPPDQARESRASQPLDLMIEALGLEIAAIKKKGGSSSTVDLVGGIFVAVSNGNYIYRFPFTGELRLRDTPIRLQFGLLEADGLIVSVGEGFVVVALESDLGPRLPRVRLIVDDSFLVERLRERLQQVKLGEATFNMASALRILGSSLIRVAKADVPKPILEGTPELNEEQSGAVALSLSSDTTFVWGPPGTGKTTVLARIVEGHYRAGRSILLVSNTNIAVDTALEKVADRLQNLENDDGFQNGAVLRLGLIVKEELGTRFGDKVSLDKVVKRLSQSFQQKLQEARSEIAVASAAVEWHRERELLRSLDDKARGLADQLRGHAATLTKLNKDLERTTNMGAVRRLFTGLNPEKLTKHIAQTEGLMTNLNAVLQSAEADCNSSRTKVEDLDSTLRELLHGAQPLLPSDQYRANFKYAEARVKELEPLAAELQKQIEQVREGVIKRCRILATTVYKTYLKGQVERQFDVVIIDEASMLMLPMSFYAAGRASRAVVVAGDFRQLPPIVMSDEPLAAEWLKKDAFDKAGIPNQVDTKKQPAYLAALKMQYRMRDDICRVTNKLTYDGLLRTHPCVDAPESRRMPLGAAQLLYVDSTSLHPWAAMKMGTYSRYNLLHALLIRKMIVHLLGDGYLREPEAAGIVASYSAQTGLIKALLDDANVSGVEAATVHRFQGNEKRTMFVDLSDSTGCAMGRFMKGVDRKDEGSRLLNVAISRAKHHIILLANFEYLRSHAPRDGKVVQLLQLFEQGGSRIDLDTILPLGNDDWVDGLHKVIPPNIQFAEDQWGAFNEAGFYAAFARDLEIARESIVILSPYLTSRGTARWVNHIRAALERGVRVRIVTKPGEEFGGASEAEVNETIMSLRALGIAVDLRGKMHEKVAIIDQRVVWHGSLNILSHSYTSESMLRLVGEASCRKLTDLITPPHCRRDKQKNPTESENPVCVACGTETVLYDGRFGLYFECPQCGEKINPGRELVRKEMGRPRQGEQGAGESGLVGNGRACIRPGCNGRMIPKNGKHGPFLGCSDYPRCRATSPS